MQAPPSRGHNSFLDLNTVESVQQHQGPGASFGAAAVPAF